jgi:cob(I)alamin adenosyltransferase
MVKLNKIYTRTGDAGETSLGDGRRVAKDSARIAVMGSVDEANAVVGIARLAAAGLADVMLARIQNELFDLGADLCAPAVEGQPDTRLRMIAGQVDRLEHEIDTMNAELAPLGSFVLPGGAPASAYLHHARTIVRRAERECWTLANQEAINQTALRYLNRLSDHLFVMARWINAQTGAGDVLWQPGESR